MATPREPAGPGGAKAVLTYNLLRLLLLVVCLVVGWAAGLRNLWLIVAALLASGLLSFFLLKRQRISMGIAMEQAVARGRDRMAQRAAAEDEYADALAREQAEDGSSDGSRP